MFEMEDASGDSVLQSDSEDDDFLSDSSEHMNQESNHQEATVVSIGENRTCD